MSVGSHLLCQHIAQHVFVTLRCVDKLNHLWLLQLKMVLLTCVIDDCFLLVNELTDVHPCSFGLFANEIAELLQIIIQIEGGLNCLKKGLLTRLGLFCLLDSLAFDFSRCFGFKLVLSA